MNWREFQSKQRISEIGDRFVSFIDEGSGETVVLLHGIPTWGFLWRDLIPQFSRTHRVLVPDMPGFGFSDKSDRFDRSIARQAEMIDRWLKQLGIERADIIAHDIGGGVALRLATLFPHRVSRLCLINTISYDSWPIELMLQFGHPEAYRKMSAATTITTLKQALKMGFASSPADEVLEGLLAPYRTEVGKLSLIRNATALNTNLTTEITHLLPQINVPTLILWGEEDKFQLIKYGERLAFDIPRARLVRIKDARHFVMLDQPQAVERELQAFLSA
jgi:pimeloyl-ACP methyl ester carboxylesterase